MTNPQTTVESAVEQTLRQVSLELDPSADHRLSADWIGEDDQGRPVLSIINLDSREHWHLIVVPLALARR
jgi:hypothetical protein